MKKTPYRETPKRDANRIIWGFLAPQIILLFLNLRAWWLIKGEVDEQQLGLAILVFSAEITLLLTNFTLLLFLITQKCRWSAKAALFMLVVHVGFLWLYFSNLHQILPSNIPSWIVNSTNILGWSATFIMPAAFISLHRLSAQTAEDVSLKRDSFMTILALITIPAAWYFFVAVSQSLLLQRYNEVLGISLFLLLTIIFLGAIIRLFDQLIHRWQKGRLSEHYILVLLLGFVGPLAGLLLNRKIPFPVDFQTPWFYVFTALNGLVLLPRPGSHPLAPLRLFARASTYPFIFYFFLVFLPFLPLSIFAILVIGAGFLMLAPLALGLYQTKITGQDFAAVKIIHGKTTAIALCLTGLVLLPGYFVAQALLDRSALQASINLIYSPDLSSDFITQAQSQRAARVLHRLHDQKQGIQLPYLSAMYRYVVSGNLVLPDKKITFMHELLRNQPLAVRSPNTAATFFPDRQTQPLRDLYIKPETDTIISSIKSDQTTPGKATLRIKLLNNTNQTHAQYTGQLRLSEGLFVSGMRLKIGEEFVSGQIFDRKTALWVFGKITAVRRDPALLFYTSANALELRVYPFPKNGTRELEIDFIFPAESIGKLILDDQSIELNSSAKQLSVISDDQKLILYADQPTLSFTRKPYLHFIFDYSQGTEIDVSQQLSAIKKITKKLAISDLRISAANINAYHPPESKLLHRDNDAALKQALTMIDLPQTGGLWVQKAISSELLHYNDALNDQNFDRVPIFVVVKNSRSLPTSVDKVDLDPWAHFTSDVEYWYLSQSDTLSKHLLSTEAKEIVPSGSSQRRLVALKHRNQVQVHPAMSPSISYFPTDENLQVYDANTHQFVTPPMLQDDGNQTQWKSFARLWSQWKRAAPNPSILEAQRTALHKQSRKLGMLIPTTGFIAVENSAQWQILERKEAQSLANQSALEFEEKQTPEPAGWILLLLMISYLVWLHIMEPKQRNGISTN